MDDRYMMATAAHHVLGDISRDEPGLVIVYGEDGENFIGEWATGFGLVNVRFPKATTRELTNDEKRFYNGKYLDVAGAVRQIQIEGAEHA